MRSTGPKLTSKKISSKKKLAALAFTLSLLAQASAQQTAPRQGERQEDEEVVRITSNLIQVDSVVLDSKGHQVTDLNAEDFEILEDGRAQTITNFSYVSSSPDAKPPADATPAHASSAGRKNPNTPPVPPARVRPGSTRRTIAFVVDDLGLSFEATAYVRNFLKRFVAEEMRPGDLLAVVRTSAGVGALQQFTNDPRLVQRAVERVRFTPGFRAPTGSFAVPADKTRPDADDSKGGAHDDNKGGTQSDADSLDRDALFTVGTLGALNYVLRGAAELPGRKSVVLITENARVFKLNGRDASVREYLQHMADLANRASASIYDLEAGDLTPDKLGSNLGIVTSVPTAPASSGAASGPGGSASAAGALAASPQSPTNFSLAETMLNDMELNDRSLHETTAALRYLARETGGARIFGVGRVLEDLKGYYLIGYRPDEKTFDPQKAGQQFHNITLRVKRPGLQVRHRTGFYSASSAETASGPPTTRAGRLMRALTSPLASGDIEVGVTPLFGNDAEAGSFVRALIHVDARGLQFTKEPDGTLKAGIEVLAVTLGESGKPLDQADGTETIRVNQSEFERLQNAGLRYTLKVPVKSPGAYQLRVAVVDEATERVGSANELVEVPNLGDGRLALSGIVLSGKATPDSTNADATSRSTTPDDASNSTTAGSAHPSVASRSAEELEADADPAVRRLRPGMELHYDFRIYNAQVEATTGRPRLQTQVRMFRDGKLAYEGKVAPFDTPQQDDLKHLGAGGQIKLSRKAAPGEYVLQIVVTDLLAKEGRNIATQWIDFEITP